jgi:hypothetical protein
MLNITLIDSSHKNKPRLDISATEVISSKDGHLILGAFISEQEERKLRFSRKPISIWEVAESIRQGDIGLSLSHDWIVKVH